jgi:pimeloyl-ACP methyl ester carboxylesterase
MARIGRFKSARHQRLYLAAYDEAMRGCPQPLEEMDVGTRHGTTRVYRFGAGPGLPMVLLPGLMNTSACYGPLLPALSEHRRVYTVDTLGEAGRSVQTAPFADIAERARCLDEVLAQLGLERVHLLGGSTGGWHAFNQAIHAPDRVVSISALEPTTLTAGFSWPVVAYGAVSVVLDRDRLWRRFLCWSADADIADRADVRLILAGIRSYVPRVPFQVPPGDDAIRAIGIPVLAVFGGRSVVHDPAVAATRLRALQPDADVEVLPGAGHYLFMLPGDREHIVERVLDFVGRHDGDRSMERAVGGPV